MRNYGATIQTLRKKKGLTQAQLAKACNVTYQTVSKWENDVNTPDLEMIERLCDVFDVGVETFLHMSRMDAPEVDTATEAKLTLQVGSGGTVSRIPTKKRPFGKYFPLFIVAVVLWGLLIVTGITLAIVFTVPLSANTIYKRVNPSVFCITVATDDGDVAGSGFFIDSAGTAVTNFHVIEGLKSAKVRTSDGKTHSVDRIIGLDREKDLAVIHVNVEKSKAVKIGKSNKLKVGAKVYAIGYPQSFLLGDEDSTLTAGIVSKTAYDIDGVHYIQSTVDFTHGNSGGVLVDSRGRVVGITTAVVDLANVNYMNMSLPSNLIGSVKRDLNLTPIKFYAEYGKRITVKYMMDGYAHSEKKFYTYEEIENYTPYVSDDMKFDGWYDDGNFSRKHDFTVKPNGNITLYAKVTRTSFEIWFADAGEMPNRKVNGDSVILPACTLVVPNYIFAGWEIDGKIYRAGERYTATQRYVHATAQWKIITEYEIVFKSDNKTVSTVTYALASGYGFTIPNIDLTQYSEQHKSVGECWGGWRAKNDSILSAGDPISVNDMQSYADGNTVTFTAVWNYVTYTVLLYPPQGDFWFVGYYHTWSSDFAAVQVDAVQYGDLNKILATYIPVNRKTVIGWTITNEHTNEPLEKENEDPNVHVKVVPILEP